MNYFTPDLLARFRSPDDPIADAANEEWEQALKNYTRHLKAIRPQLPTTVRRLLGRFRLHDARVSFMAPDKDWRSFSILLLLDSPRDEAVELVYKLAARPDFLTHPSASDREAPLAWLYDEIDVLKEKPISAF